MTSDHYESVYGVSLLDDLHNYFPAVLYEPSSFSNVQQLLAYVQSQTRHRFDLFSRGLNSYQRSAAAAVPPPSFQTRASPLYTGVHHTFSDTVPIRVSRPRVSQTEELLSFINLFLGSPATFQQNFPNVIVRPTAQQIAAATTLSTVETTTADICAVCQDGYGMGNERRQLNVCHHTFHRGCIDTWFQENVHCPVCRHDIREPAAVANANVVNANATVSD